MKKVWGLVLHFGYVETGIVAPLIIHHVFDGFDTLREALTNLANYLLEDFLHMQGEGYQTIDNFEEYLRGLGSYNASSGPICFDSSHVNGEEWWPWDTMRELVPHLGHFYENKEQSEVVLARHIDLSKFAPKEWMKIKISDEFRKEIEEYQTPPDYTDESGP